MDKMNKKWNIAEKYDKEFESRFPEMSGVVLQLLWNRNLKTQEQIDVFLGPDYVRDQYDPFLFMDMKKTVERIFKAIKNKENIVVYGDYDADGVSSTAVMYATLKHLGAENLSVYIPNRMKEGYGLNKGSVDYLIEKGVDLVVTVDCGISGAEEVGIFQANEIDVIITDHHMEPSELPDAYAIICPTLKRENYEFRELAGVGVAFKVAQALLREEKKSNEAFEKWLLDLVAIGTVADCMPLLDENRTLVKWGLLVLNKTQRLGLRELIASANIKGKLGTYNVGFQIAPRLNAAGRMDHANTAYELLVTDDEAESLAIANDLNQKNQARQKLTEEMMKISLEQIGEVKDSDKLLIIMHEGWSAGLVGLVAGRLADRFYRPVLVFGKDKETYIGSGRSVKEFDITSALQQTSEHLKEFGGHAQACGLTIEGSGNYEKFREKIIKVANEKLKEVELAPSIEIEAETVMNEMNWELINILDKFVPFGEGNPEPKFLTRNLVVDNIVAMGQAGKHLRFDLKSEQGGKAEKFVAFGAAEKWAEIKINDKIDVVYEFGVNEWNGNRELQFKVIDLASSLS